MLLASPGRPYRAGSGFTADQADAWYCSDSLKLAAWSDGRAAIPTLSALSVHVGGPRLRLLVAGRPWLEPVLDPGSRSSTPSTRRVGAATPARSSSRRASRRCTRTVTCVILSAWATS